LFFPSSVLLCRSNSQLCSRQSALKTKKIPAPNSMTYLFPNPKADAMGMIFLYVGNLEKS
ncbi:MAG: hypothetical protein J7K96_12160, partial [Desulfobacteraceae bacterium]|nr:hypothetical protein [Desulfobacteraceae bacterium]